MDLPRIELPRIGIKAPSPFTEQRILSEGQQDGERNIPEMGSYMAAPFEQGDGSASRKYGGTGLGLAISTELVAMMHGDCWVESPWSDPVTAAAVAGSAFHFTAQFSRGQAPIDAPSALPLVQPEKLRILLAEDNLVNQRLALRMLEKRGHTVLVANDGREAIAILQREQVDIVLMDVQMPDLDGFQATAAIRDHEKTSGDHLPIVALTAHALKGDKERCLANGMDAYLSKPIRPEDLDRAIAEASLQRSAFSGQQDRLES